MSRGGNAAAQGVGKLGLAMSKSTNKYIRAAGSGLYSGSRSTGAALTRAGAATQIWGRKTNAGKALGGVVNNAGGYVGKTLNKNGVQSTIRSVADKVSAGSRGSAKALGNVSNNTLARIGAGAVGAGLGVAAGRNAYRAATAKKHAAQAKEFRAEMNKAFVGTKYANGMPAKQKKRRK